MATAIYTDSPLHVFYSYAHEDQQLCDKLEKALAPLEREGLIQGWHDRQIGAGTEWKDSIDKNLEAAQIILLLVSADFLASDYCYDKEMKRALEKHEAGEARVIPVILRSVDWTRAPFGKLLALPTGGKPVTSWANRDEAFANIALGIRAVAEEITGAAETSQPGKGSLKLSSLKAQDKGPDISLVDVIVRNTGSSESVIHTAEFDVIEARPKALGAHPMYFASTYQYNVLMTPSDKCVTVDVSQVVPAKRVDRFQIILGLGIEEKDYRGPIGIGWIIDPDTDTKLVYLDTKMKLRLVYDENKILESPPFAFRVYAPGAGFKADKIAGLKLEDKIRLLSDKDINVVQSVVEVLGSIGGPAVLQALRDLQASNLGYLRDKYFRERLDEVIEHLANLSAEKAEPTS